MPGGENTVGHNPGNDWREVCAVKGGAFQWV
jgi:hypothetical protein